MLVELSMLQGNEHPFTALQSHSIRMPMLLWEDLLIYALILIKCSLFLNHMPDVYILPLSFLTFHVFVPPSFIYFMIFLMTYWHGWLSTHGAWHTWSALKLQSSDQVTEINLHHPLDNLGCTVAPRLFVSFAPLTGFLEMTPKKLPQGHMMVCVAWYCSVHSRSVYRKRWFR